MLDYKALRNYSTVENKIETLTCEKVERVMDYINTIHETKARKNMTFKELQERIKKLFLKLDKEWFFDQQLERYKKIKADFMKTNIQYNEQSKLAKHLTGVDKLEEAANAVRKILL